MTKGQVLVVCLSETDGHHTYAAERVLDAVQGGIVIAQIEAFLD